MSSHIRLDREAFDHPLLRDGDRFRAWFWMIARACWKPTQFDLHGKTVDLARGQFVVSRSQLAEAWGWSPSAVERFLTRLQTEQMIGRETGQGRSIITIRNYDKYQAANDIAGQANGQETGQRADSERTAKEEGNKELPNGSSTKDARKAHRLPLDWQPKPLPPEIAAFVTRWPAGAIERELARFRDWAASAPARSGLKNDWDAAWRNWLRRAEEEGRYRDRQHSHSAKPSTRDIGERVAARFAGVGDGVADLVPRLGAAGGNG